MEINVEKLYYLLMSYTNMSPYLVWNKNKDNNGLGGEKHIVMAHELHSSFIFPRTSFDVSCTI